MKTIVLSLLALLAFSANAPAQTPTYIRSSWTSGPTTSFLFNSNDGKIQSLYYPSDFQGMPGGFVRNLYLRVNASGNDNLNYKNVKVSMGYTTDSMFSASGGSCVFMTGLSPVYFSSVCPFTSMKTQGKWIKFSSIGDWLYDPTKNFIVEISHGPEGANNYGGFNWMASNTGNPRHRSISGGKDSITTKNLFYSFLDLGFDLSPNGIENYKSLKSFGLFPNPSTNGRFVVSLEGTAPLNHVTITVSNSLGQTIFRKQLSEKSSSLFEEIELNDASPGLYYVEIITTDDRVSRKLLIQ